MSQQFFGCAPVLQLQQPDGSWLNVSDSVSEVVITRECGLLEDLLAIPTIHRWQIEVPVKWVSPRNPADMLVRLYESAVKSRCPGSWKTQRLKKKRMKALNQGRCHYLEW